MKANFRIVLIPCLLFVALAVRADMHAAFAQCPPGAGPPLPCPTEESEEDDSETGPPPEGDRDGDGTIDVFDACPDFGGPNNNQGCPEGMEPQSEEEPSPTPIVLPTLPDDGCFAATQGATAVNIRSDPNLNAAVVGRVDPTQLVPVLGQVESEDGTWVLTEPGWSALRVLRLSPDCAFQPLSDDCPQFQMLSTDQPPAAGRFGAITCQSPEQLFRLAPQLTPLFSSPITTRDLNCPDDFIIVRFQGSPYGGPADQIITGDTFIGTMCDEIIYGNDNDNMIDGGFGNDIILGFGGDDTLHGNLGVDVLFGFDGNDTLFAGPGDFNFLYGMGGSDNLVGDEGRDVLVGDEYVTNDPFLNGPSTISQVNFSGVDPTTPSSGNDVMQGVEDWDILFGAAGSDILIGGSGSDWLVAFGGDDFMDGDVGGEPWGEDLCDDGNGPVPC